ncbi:MAG: hypothetical protein IPP40_17270 [bacterium]|nr:hypothetical protein [bacterium]
MRHTLLIFILSLIPLSAKAVIPLQLLTEIQLPLNNGWDAQYFYNDSTITWVSVGHHDTLYYDLGDGAGMHAIQLLPPDSAREDYRFSHYKYPVIFKDAASTDNPAVAVVAVFVEDASYSCLTYSEAYRIDLTTGAAQSSAFWGGSTSCNQYVYAEAEVSSHEVWPPLPANSQRIVIGSTGWSDRDGMGDHHSNTYCDAVAVYSAPAFTSLSYRDSCTAFSILQGTAQFEMVAAGGASSSSSWPCGQGWNYCTRDRCTKVLFSATGAQQLLCEADVENGEPQTFCRAASSIAGSIDENGSKYAIIDTVCFDPYTGNEIWTNSDLINASDGSVVGLSFPTSDQQSFFVGHWQYFEIFDPATAEHLGTTAQFQGEFVRALNLPGKLGEFVTYDPPTRTVRFYRVIPAPERLIITYLPQHNYIWLAWDPVPGATAYRVCRMYRFQ